MKGLRGGSASKPWPQESFVVRGLKVQKEAGKKPQTVLIGHHTAQLCHSGALQPPLEPDPAEALGVPLEFRDYGHRSAGHFSVGQAGLKSTQSSPLQNQHVTDKMCNQERAQDQFRGILKEKVHLHVHQLNLTSHSVRPHFLDSPPNCSGSKAHRRSLRGAPHCQDQLPAQVPKATTMLMMILY
ncbi:uncharacterized protein ACIQIH_014937 isoform 1-T1 [Cyanocitta cristata]